jgi:Peptidase M15
MTIDRFTNDPERVKRFTNPTGAGLSRSIAPQLIGSGGNPSPYYEVSVRDKPGIGSDQIITHTGPGAAVMGGIGDPTDLQGFISPTGNKIVIDNTFGSDTVTIQHHTGATILIDADGSIHMISSGKKGFGLVAPTGDGTLFSRGHMILKGDGRITVETKGDLDFNVGGSVNFHVDHDMTYHVKGTIEEVAGSKITEVEKELSTMVGGDHRITVAGNMQTQVSGNKSIDAGGDINIRTDGNFSLNTQQTLKAIAKALISIDTKDTVTVTSSGNMTLQTAAAFATLSSGTTKISASGTSIHSSGTVGVYGSGEIQIKGSDTTIQTSGSASPDSPGTAATAALAQYVPANTIIDNITTTRVAPDFPANAKYMSKEEFSLYKNEGANVNPKAEAAATPNSGGGVVPQLQDSGISAEPVTQGTYDKPAGNVTNNGKAEQNPMKVSYSIYNTNEKISRHITIGQVLGIRSVPHDQQKSVIDEAMNTAWNIIDPLIEHFGSRIEITSWWRNNSSNHIKGGAVDVRAANKNDVALTAEIAAYVRDNLPYNQVFLEKNDSPGIHCHVQSAQPGQPGGGKVYTCADPHCNQKVDGIQLSYAVAALEGRHVG